MKRPVIVNLSGAASCGAFADPLGVSIKRGATGRVVEDISDEGRLASMLVDQWFSCEVEEEFKSHCAFLLIRDALSMVQAYEQPLALYRGRRFRPSEEPPLYGKQFGPPPSPAHNRYSREGEAALYLSSTLPGVHAELEGSLEPGDALYAHPFCVPLGCANLANLVSCTVPALLLHAFDRAEQAREPSGYFHSQCLAELVRASGYSGMVVPGVRAATPADQYHNVVLFDVENEAWMRFLPAPDSPLLIVRRG